MVFEGPFRGGEGSVDCLMKMWRACEWACVARSVESYTVCIAAVCRLDSRIHQNRAFQSRYWVLRTIESFTPRLVYCGPEIHSPDSPNSGFVPNFIFHPTTAHERRG